MLFRLKIKVTLVDLDVLLYKWFLMILGGILTVGTLIATIFTLVFGPGLGWAALMLFCSLIGAVTFYSGWEIGRGRPEDQELQSQETTDVEHHQES